MNGQTKIIGMKTIYSSTSIILLNTYNIMIVGLLKK